MIPQIVLAALSLLKIGIKLGRFASDNTSDNKAADVAVTTFGVAGLHLILWWGGWYG